MARCGAPSSACASSLPDPGCTCRRSNKRISGWADEATLECKTEWVAAHPEKVQLREYLVEQPFELIKRRYGRGFFAILDPSRVMMEMSLTLQACDIQRAARILRVPHLIEALN